MYVHMVATMYVWSLCLLYISHSFISILFFIGSLALTVNIIKKSYSMIIVQWDAVDDFLPTTYTIFWTNGRNLIDAATVEEQTSYTITGLTLDTVYTITVTAANT